ncbi:MAG: SBBP repeat-containing protein [Chloroflexi bacterium]|nr:SBBP repeat-containing protein [Chloroflexota bacterium]
MSPSLAAHAQTAQLIHTAATTTFSEGIIRTYAGSHFGDGNPATQASVDFPEGVAVDKAGNLYIADTNNNCVREVIAATGVIITVAGTGMGSYGGDGGPATQAALNSPRGVAATTSPRRSR